MTERAAPISMLGAAHRYQVGNASLVATRGRWYVYGLRLATELEYRYVGQTTRTLSKRFYMHNWEAHSRGSHLPVHKWMRKHAGEEILIEALGSVNEGDLGSLNELEIAAIATLRAEGNRLLNVTEGGEGTIGYRGTPEKNKRHSEKMTGPGNPRYGTKWTDELRQKIAAALPDQSGENSSRWGATNSPEHRQKISENHHDVSGENNPFHGKTHSEHTREKMRSAAANRSEEERAAISAKHSATLKARTPEQLADFGAKMSAARKSRPDLQVALTKAAAAAAASRTQEERDAITAKKRATAASKSPEERAASAERRANAWTPEQRAEQAERARLRAANRTPEQNAAIAAKRLATIAAKKNTERKAEND